MSDKNMWSMGEMNRLDPATASPDPMRKNLIIKSGITSLVIVSVNKRIMDYF